MLGNHIILEKIVGVFDAIKNTSSRTDKERILRENENFTEFRKILEFLYNTFMLTGIKTKKLVKFSDFKSDAVTQFDSVLEAIDYITSNNSGRDENVKVIANFINQHKGRVHDFLQELFTKDLKIGVTATTINKVYGKGTVPKFEVMLAKKYEDEESKISRFFITLKLDGIRCIAIKKNNSVKFFTRQGKPIEGLEELEQEFIDHFPDGYVYDGELLLEKSENIPSGELFRATQKVVRKNGVKTGLHFYMFDFLTVEEFMQGKSESQYHIRRASLENLFKPYEGGIQGDWESPKLIKKVPLLYKGKDKKQIFKMLDEVIEQGEEGLMVNSANGYYVTKRTNNLLKVKKMYPIDLEVVGYEEGTGKNKGTLGALIVDYKGYQVKVGSGYSDGERDVIWGNRDNMIGKIIEVQYFEESNNEDGGLSLRLPIFKTVRNDKDEVSLD